MNKYLIKVQALEWHDLAFIIEAESEEEALMLLDQGEGDLEYDDYNCTDKSEVISVKEL